MATSDFLTALSQRIHTSNNPEYTLENLPHSFWKIDQLAAFQPVQTRQTILQHTGVPSPYFLTHQQTAGATTEINDQPHINFATYNYLGLNGQPTVKAAAQAAIEQYGTSVSSSRIVSGERHFHRELETAIAAVYQAEDSVAFVSGHATNVSTIGHLFGEKDLILHDALSHNSIVQGALLSGAARLSFPHNDMHVLNDLLTQHRLNYQKVLIVTEGLFSMDGDTPPLAELITLKQQHKTFLMVDEAHSLGVLGQTGRGSFEQQQVNPQDIDLWMGTLSKTLASCGGYIAGNAHLIEYLRYTAPGFLYSVGLAPPLAAASLAALQHWQMHPEYVTHLQHNGHYFLQQAQHTGLDTGHAEGHAVIPIIIGNSLRTVKIAHQLMTEHQVIAQPVIYPAVAEKSARLRFFLTCNHTAAHIDHTIHALQQLLTPDTVA